MFSSSDKDLAATIFDTISQATADPAGGVTRSSYGAGETRAANIIADAASWLGLHTQYDAAANLVITSKPGDPPSNAVWLGSHLDSVPRGGNFDGLAGVVAAVLVLAKARMHGSRRPLVGLGLRGEESAWFGIPHVGAKAMLGTLEPSDLERACLRTTPDLATTLGARMQDVGAATSHLRKRQPIVHPRDIAEWWELHIEQGPVLDDSRVPVGIVTGISGSVRAANAVMRGKAGHSGATPHATRDDAVMCFVHLMSEIENLRTSDMRVTCGMVSTNPERHALTTISDEVRFSLDVRGMDITEIEALYDAIRGIGGRALEIGDTVTTLPMVIDEEMCDRAVLAATALQVRHMAFPSGAGHDTSIFAGAGIKSGMIFVRNHNGSHNPAEMMGMNDFMEALEVLYAAVTA